MGREWRKIMKRVVNIVSTINRFRAVFLWDKFLAMDFFMKLGVLR